MNKYEAWYANRPKVLLYIQVEYLDKDGTWSRGSPICPAHNIDRELAYKVSCAYSEKCMLVLTEIWGHNEDE